MECLGSSVCLGVLVKALSDQLLLHFKLGRDVVQTSKERKEARIRVDLEKPL